MLFISNSVKEKEKKKRNYYIWTITTYNRKMISFPPLNNFSITFN